MTETADTFTCANCGKTFDRGWSDEEAAAEAEALLPGINPAERVAVCDDCYETILARVRAEAPHLLGPGWREAQAQWEADHPRCYMADAGFMVHVRPGCRGRR